MNCENRIIALPTMDGDPGADYPRRHGVAGPAGEAQKQAYRNAVERIIHLFDDFGLAGRTTWFVNEIDVNWSADFPDLLKKFAARRDTVALHVHHNGLFLSPRLISKESFLESSAPAVKRIESVTGTRICHYRSGCYHQREYVYSALAEMGMEVISDVFPGLKVRKENGFDLDNSSIPLGVAPWRHEDWNWLDYQSGSGRFLQIPVSAGAIDHLPLLPGKVLDNGITTVCWGIHPHEIQARDGSISDAAVNALKTALEGIDKNLKPVYLNFDEFRKHSRKSN